MNVQIVQDVNVTSWYNVCLRSPNYSRCYTYDQNTWFPDAIQIGEELNGSGGSYSPQTSWTDNLYISSNGSGGLSGYPQNRLPDGYIINNPPYAGWQVGNDPTQNPNGGIWLANCC